MEPNCGDEYFKYVLTLAKTGLEHLQVKNAKSYEAGIAARALEAINMLQNKYQIVCEVLQQERANER